MLAPSTTRGMSRQRPPRRLEEPLIEMYLAGISVRRVEHVTEALGGPCQPGYGVEPEQENLGQDRGLTETTRLSSRI